MSNHAHRQPHQSATGPEVELVLVIARLQGCTCQPEIRVPQQGARRGHLTVSDVYHDDDCALLRRLNARNN
jgi:hypothetical protein